MEAIVKTNFNFPDQTSHYVGKVRDVYSINDEYLVMVVSDRISAFDVVLPEGIPFKGQVLNQIAAKFLDATTDILPNWKIATTSDDRYLLSFILTDFTLGQIRCMGDGTTINKTTALNRFVVFVVFFVRPSAESGPLRRSKLNRANKKGH